MINRRWMLAGAGAIAAACCAHGQETIYSNTDSVVFGRFGGAVTTSALNAITLDGGGDVTSLRFSAAIPVRGPQFDLFFTEAATVVVYLDDGDGNPDDDGDGAADPENLIYESAPTLVSLREGDITLRSLDLTGAGVSVPANATLWVGVRFSGDSGELFEQAVYSPPSVGSTGGQAWISGLGVFSLGADAGVGFEIVALATVDPCDAADRDGNGVVNVIDLLTFLVDWFHGDPSADLDGSGTTDVLDLLAYLRAWFDCRVGGPPGLPGGGG